MKNALIVFAKFPIPGFVKTRLARDIGNAAATFLYRQFINHTIRKFADSDNRYQLRVAVAQEQYVARFSLEFPGANKYVAQSNGDLGARMQFAIRQCLEEGFERIVVIGTDSPHLPVENVHKAFELLGHNDVVLGPAEDGGYYLLAAKEDFRCLFTGMPWGTNQVLRQTKAAIAENNLSSVHLPKSYDIDDIGSLRRLFDDELEVDKGVFECMSKAKLRQILS